MEAVNLPMNDTHGLMQIFNSLANLLDDMSTQILSQRSKLGNLVIELATRAKFQNHVAILACLRRVDKLDYILMVEFPCDLDLLDQVFFLRQG